MLRSPLQPTWDLTNLSNQLRYPSYISVVISMELNSFSLFLLAITNLPDPLTQPGHPILQKGVIKEEEEAKSPSNLYISGEKEIRIQRLRT